MKFEKFSFKSQTEIAAFNAETFKVEGIIEITGETPCQVLFVVDMGAIPIVFSNQSYRHSRKIACTVLVSFIDKQQVRTRCSLKNSWYCTVEPAIWN